MEWYEIKELEENSKNAQEFEKQITDMVMEILEWKPEDLE